MENAIDIVITDFETDDAIGDDQIIGRGSLSFLQEQGYIADDGTNTTIASFGITVVLEGVLVSDLSEDNFA